MRKLLNHILLLALLGVFGAGSASLSAQTTSGETGVHVAEIVSPSVVLILTGRGAGQLDCVGTGIIVRTDGVLLTAYHLVKDAREVQVRLKNGEVYDKVELIAFDERRDVAALRVPAVGLTALPRGDAAAEMRVGQAVYVVSNPRGLSWSVSNGILSGVRMADDVAGAGVGYQLLQHTAAVSGGSSGGALVDEHGYALGIVVGTAGDQNLNFAVPINSVVGLANSNGRTPLGAGTDLRPPEPERAPSAASVLKTDPNEILRTAKIVYVRSNTSYFEDVQLQNALRKQTDFVAWQMAIVDGWEGRKLADIEIEIDRPLFTYTFTYKISDVRTSIILATGKVNAWDGNDAAPQLAERIVAAIKKVRQPPAPGKKETAKDEEVTEKKN
ncbi:MAG: serine protease Do [Acidobacteriota bacterium]|nr:serine protease Do [Acidobacteriota bacterium]